MLYQKIIYTTEKIYKRSRRNNEDNNDIHGKTAVGTSQADLGFMFALVFSVLLLLQVTTASNKPQEEAGGQQYSGIDQGGTLALTEKIPDTAYTVELIDEDQVLFNGVPRTLNDVLTELNSKRSNTTDFYVRLFSRKPELMALYIGTANKLFSAGIYVSLEE